MSERSPRPARILVVDDEPEVCRLLQDALVDRHLEVTGATSVAQALDAARRNAPDLVVADVRLGDGDGLELIRRLRADASELPAIIITGHGNAAVFSEASRLRPVEVLNKPIDLPRLRRTVYAELKRLQSRRGLRRRRRQVHDATRQIARKRRKAYRILSATCTDLTAICRDLQGQVDRQDALIRYQTDLLTGTGEDDTFSRFFRLFVERSGPVLGVAMLCDEEAELQMVGRFGVPVPDGINFCRALAMSTVDGVLGQPEITVLDAYDNLHTFPSHIHRMLVGVTLMVVPLMIGPGKLIGLVVLYRRGEQPFTDEDMALAEMIAPPTAAAAQRT